MYKMVTHKIMRIKFRTLSIYWVIDDDDKNVGQC